MRILENDNRFLIRLEIGEELVKSLTSFAAQRNVTLGSVQGIGALRDVEIGYYDLNQKEYLRSTITEIVELISCSGNLAMREGRPFAHLHVVLGRPDFHLVGGHLFEGIVAVTAELFVHPVPASVHRKLDETTGLYLLNLVD